MDNAKGTTKGFCFVEYSSVQEAAAAKEQLQAYKLDKNHTLTANMFDDVEKYMKVPDEYVSMQVAPFNPVTELQSWMTDRLGRDQFVVRHGVQEVEVYWNDGKRFRPEEVRAACCVLHRRGSAG
jgi:translation initiation factor 3 subunit B